MTVSYIGRVHNGNLGTFVKLLRVWRGSLLKGIWRDLLAYIILYTIISLLYRFVILNNASGKDYEFDSRTAFEYACVYCSRFSHMVPLSFLLGFYVSLIMTRWWNQCEALSWPDELAMNLNSYLPGKGKAREIRRAVVRWICLSNILTLRQVSKRVKDQFKEYQDIVEQNLMTPNEMEKLKQIQSDVKEQLQSDKKEEHTVIWYPILWAQNLLRDARKEKEPLIGENGEPLIDEKGEPMTGEPLIGADLFYVQLIHHCNKVSKQNSQLIKYGWINIPLVYTQVVTIAVYSYFAASLLGGQFLTPQYYTQVGNIFVKVEGPSVHGSVNLIGYDNNNKDIYVPVFNILEFIFYMGWLQVAVTLINPFGEDDDDFDVDYLCHRNIKVAMRIVEEDSVELDPCPLQRSALSLPQPNKKSSPCPSFLKCCTAEGDKASTVHKYNWPRMPTEEKVDKDTEDPVEVKTDSEDSLEVKTDSEDSVEVKTDSDDPVEVKTDSDDPVEVKIHLDKTGMEKDDKLIKKEMIEPGEEMKQLNDTEMGMEENDKLIQDQIPV